MSSQKPFERTVVPFVFEASVGECAAEVYLNDIPLSCLRSSEGFDRYGVSINHFVRNGKNTVELLVEVGDSPSTARRSTGRRSALGMSAELKVSRYVPGSAIGRSPPQDVLQHLRFSGDGRELAFPLSMRGEFFIRTPFPTWAWERAEELRMDDRLVGEVVSFLEGCRRTFVTRNISAENALSDLLVREVCVAFGSSPSVKRAALNELLVDEWSRTDWGVEPIDRSRLDLRLCAEGRLVQCIDRDWEDVFRSTPDASGGRMFVPMFLGRYDGALRRLR